MYLLYHRPPDGSEIKIIGVFSKRKLATEIKKKNKVNLGLRKIKDTFILIHIRLMKSIGGMVFSKWRIFS